MTLFGWLTVAAAAALGWLLWPAVYQRLTIPAISSFAHVVARIVLAFAAALSVGLVLHRPKPLAAPPPQNAIAQPTTPAAPAPAAEPQPAPLPPLEHREVEVRKPVRPMEPKPAVTESTPQPEVVAPTTPQPAPSERSEAPAPTLPVDKCSSGSGLAREICRECDGKSGLGLMFCEGSTRNLYCADKKGKDPDCPLEEQERAPGGG